MISQLLPVHPKADWSDRSKPQCIAPAQSCDPAFAIPVPFEHHMFSGFLHTGYCISAVVANSFLTVPLSYIPIGIGRTGMTTFHFLTGIRFVLTIADDSSAFSCSRRAGKSVPGPQCIVRA
jgi:hypothetical protein